MVRQNCNRIYILFALLLICNIGFWFHTHHLQARWANVPGAPSRDSITVFGLSDLEFSYRATGMMMQNFGNTGADYKPLKDYDYTHVAQWLMLSDWLDPASNFMPNLAAYYFGATQTPATLGPIVDYLEKQGLEPGAEKWRWMAQAVYLARFRQHDMARALKCANELAAQWQPGRPLWMKEMPALVMTASGDKAMAYGIMLAILKEEAGKVQQPELNSTIVYICTRILDKDAAAKNPICLANPTLMK